MITWAVCATSVTSTDCIHRLENYGHWGFPGEFLMYGGQSDEIGGEFWSEGELGDIENRAASSSPDISTASVRFRPNRIRPQPLRSPAIRA